MSNAPVMRYTYAQPKEDIKQIQTLWQQAFDEERPFMQYYFKYIYGNNRILVAKDGERIVSMIHLNPYLYKVGKVIQPVYYIAGVATDQAYRGQGIMSSLMEKAFKDLKSEGESFTLLTPAKEAYYTSLGFVTCGYRDEIVIPESVLVADYQQQEITKERTAFFSNGSFTIRPLSSMQWSEIENVAEALLKEQMVYPMREQSYLRRLFWEMEAYDGSLALIIERGQITGYMTYAFYENEIRISQLLVKDGENGLSLHGRKALQLLRTIQQFAHGRKVWAITDNGLIDPSVMGKESGIQIEQKPSVMVKILEKDRLPEGFLDAVKQQKVYVRESV